MPVRNFTVATYRLLLLAAIATPLAGCSEHPSPAAATSPAISSAMSAALLSATSPVTSVAPPNATSAAPPSATSAVTSASHPSPTGTSSPPYREPANGSTLHVKVGDRFSIALGEKDELVDNWEMQTGKGLAVVSVDLDLTTAPPPPTTGGADATRIWVLQATAAGSQRLEASCFGKGR
jgi:predicted secreted protein